MSFVVKLLNEKKEEYEFLLNRINDQLERGNVYRSQWEIDCALQSKAYHESILSDINEKLGLIGQ